MRYFQIVFLNIWIVPFFDTTSCGETKKSTHEWFSFRWPSTNIRSLEMLPSRCHRRVATAVHVDNECWDLLDGSYNATRRHRNSEHSCQWARCHDRHPWCRIDIRYYTKGCLLDTIITNNFYFASFINLFNLLILQV